MKNHAKKFRPMILARESLGLTQAEFADLLEISPNYVYLIESGAKQPGPKIIKKLSDLESKKCESVHEKSEPYGVMAAARSTKIPPMPGIEDCPEEVLLEQIDHFWSELIKPLGSSARFGTTGSLLTFVAELHRRSMKHWINKQRGKS